MVTVVYRYKDKVSLPVGTHRFLIRSSGARNSSFQWISHQAAGVASSVTLYGTLEDKESTLLDGNPTLDPEVGGYFYELPAANNFDSFPDGSIKSQILPMADDPHAFTMVEIVVTTLIPSFSFIHLAKV